MNQVWQRDTILLDTWTGLSIEMQQQHLSNLSGAKMSSSIFCALSRHTNYGLRADAGQRLDFIFSPFNAPTHSFQGPMQEGAKVSSQERQILGLQMDQEVVRPTFGRFHRSPRFFLNPQGSAGKRLDPGDSVTLFFYRNESKCC